MLVPRIILSIPVKAFVDLGGIQCIKRTGLLLTTRYLTDSEGVELAQRAKMVCLAIGVPLFFDDLRLATLTNADGVLLHYGDYSQGRAKDVLGDDKLIGAVAHSIEDIVQYWEEGMTDFIILESYMETDRSTNILGKQKSQTILDDAKIMGYDIPILLAGGVNSKNATEILAMACYGLVTETIDDLLDLQGFLPR